ncbi:E3 ubiquitin-protein ligase Praja-2 [Porphyrio hochstetteri]
MGQEACKHAWQTDGGYQTIRGRRYRRHASVSFRPSFNSQGRDEHQHDEDSEQLELEDVREENSSPVVDKNISIGFDYSNAFILKVFCEGSSLSQASSHSLDELLLENIGTEEPGCQNAPRQAIEANTSPLSVYCDGLEGKEATGNFMNPSENSEDLAESTSGGCNDLNGQNGIAFVNLDAYDPDGSDGEEDDDHYSFSLAREEASVVPEALHNMFFELQRDVEPFSDLQSKFSTLSHCISRECFEEAGPIPSRRYFSMDPGFACPNNRIFGSFVEDQAVLGSNMNGASYETQLTNNTVDVEVRTPVAVTEESNVSDRNSDEESSPELVVRRKSRKENTADQVEGEKFLPSDEEESSWRRTETAEVQQGWAECALRSKEEMSSSMVFDSRQCEGHQKNLEGDVMKNAVVQGDSPSDKDEDSSECSDGEWPTAVPPYFTAAERAQSVSEESWETVPGRDGSEPQVQSSSSGVEENTDFCFERGEQESLEEGEIPWLQYQEAEQSSSDEENDSVDFVYPGWLLLEGSNNLDDDFDVNEDPDVEWRLLGEFDDLGLVQTVYVDPQFLPFTPLAGPLHFFETALAQLESLGFDEQANPPATGETIDSLPQIIVTGDREGEQHCCTICCSEYVKDEIITELPCHHLFHRPCVTLWLQKSGTCPVCRHVLEPVVPEEAAASSMSDDDSSSVHSATERSN